MRENRTAKTVAEALVQVGAVGYNLQELTVFASGIKSPVYVNNRILSEHTKEWHIVIKGFEQLIQDFGIIYDMIAGVEVAGVPHGAALGYDLLKPFTFVRKKPKDHGKPKKVEGNVNGKKVLLIEDHITTAESSLNAAKAIEDEGGIVDYCLSITTYAFPEAREAFIAAGVVLHSLTEFAYILDAMISQGKITSKDRTIIEEWLENPRGWSDKREKASE